MPDMEAYGIVFRAGDIECSGLMSEKDLAWVRIEMITGLIDGGDHDKVTCTNSCDRWG